MSNHSRSRAPGRSRRRSAAALAALVTVLTTGLTVVGAGTASAVLAPAPTGVGPIDAASLFPSYYQDTNGLAL
jgi:hypothetical protein